MEPHRLRKWKTNTPSQGTQLFTCGRPERSKCKSRPVPDALVIKWLRGLPIGTNIVIVSLLGRKHGPYGESEFSFYSFYGKGDNANERRNRLSFQDWIAHFYKDRSIKIIEYPTYDFCPIESEVMDAISEEISNLLSRGCTVILMDSGGIQRTGAVCKHMGFSEDTQKPLKSLLSHGS